MTDNTPNGPLDILTQEVSKLRLTVTSLTERLNLQEQFQKRILDLLRRQDEAFDIRVARAQYNVFHHMAHGLEGAIQGYQKQLDSVTRGFDVEVVDGVNVLETADSIIVRKVPEGGYNYSRVTDPDTVENEGTESISSYLNEHPDVFGDRETIVINLMVHIRGEGTSNG